jgi:hypothetical protein
VNTPSLYVFGGIEFEFSLVGCHGKGLLLREGAIDLKKCDYSSSSALIALGIPCVSFPLAKGHDIFLVEGEGPHWGIRPT